MTRGVFTVAHAVRRQPHPFGGYVYRSHHRASLRLALKQAGRIQRAGYLAWIERTGTRATR